MLLRLFPLLYGLALGAPDPDFGNGSSWEPTFTKWSMGKDAAISLTFDDNCASQFQYAVPALISHELTATFFVIAQDATIKNLWPAYRDLVARGFEIGSHSLTHPDFSLLGEDARNLELSRSRALIDSLIPAQKCFSLALPQGWRDRQLLEDAKRFYGAVRIVNQWDGLHDVKDVEEVRGMIPYRGTPLVEMDRWVTLALAKNRWLVEIYHGFQDECWEPISPSRFTAHLDRIERDRSRLWIAPFGSVAKYFREREEASVSLTSYRDSVLEYGVKERLPEDIYNYPLTVRARLPAGWTDFTAEQAGVPTWSEFRWEQNMPIAVFEARPNQGGITLRRGRMRTSDTVTAEAHPVSGIYPTAPMVSLISSMPGQILYTLDGSDPSTFGIPYQHSFQPRNGACVRYLAISRTGVRSEPRASHYVISGSASTIQVVPPEGTYVKPLVVSLQSDSNSPLRYTLDGSDPDSTSPIYSSPIKISKSTKLKVILETSGNGSSPVLVQSYTLVSTTASVSVTPPGGEYSEIQRVVLSGPPGHTLIYTLDGSDPLDGRGIPYGDPIWIDRDAVLNIRLLGSGGAASVLRQEQYRIVPRQGLSFSARPLSELGERQGRISFSVGTLGRVRLVLRDVLGQEILKLFEDRAEPLHQYSFPMPTDPIIPGVYFWTLEMEGIPILKRRVVFHR